MKITDAGNSRSLSISSEVIMCSAPGIGSGRGFEPVAITICLASSSRSPTRTRLGPANTALPLITSTSRLAIDQCGPVEPRLADRDMMHRCALDFVQRVAGCDQHLLRGAAAVRAGAAE